MNEEWRDVSGWPGYSVSSTGRVKGRSGKILRPAVQEGYPTVRLHRSGARFGITVSRLMLLAFVGEPPNSKYQAAHLDGNPGNNILSNLAWATPEENNSHKLRHGTQFFGEQLHSSVLTEKDVREIKARLRADESCVSISRSYRVTADAIQKIKQGRNWGWLDA